MSHRKTIILGAAGRDFHNFNTYFRDNEDYKVIAFTAAQIPDIADRKYPSTLSGLHYPNGIPILAEEDLEKLIKEHAVTDCFFSYSDVSYTHVMSIASRINAAGANFILLPPDATMLKSLKPVIAVCATRTGVGKSQTSRKIIELLMAKGLRVVAIRHPMPYGDLEKQKLQRYAELADLEKHNCTIEEMEEYEPHITRGNVIYAGVDYEAILRAAENDPNGCDVILWDGGNNDFSFYHADLYITLLDPLRPGHELQYYPSEINLHLSDVAIVNKVGTAILEDVHTVEVNARKLNPTIKIIEAASPVHVNNPEAIRGKRVLVVEDGPSLTHGNMKIGAGTVAALKYDAAEIIDPRPFIKGKIAETFDIYPDIGQLLPAMGYSDEQLQDLEETINATDCDTVIIGTPMDLNRIININHETARVFYNLQSIGTPSLEEVLTEFANAQGLV